MEWINIIILIILSAIFSGLEIAFITSDKLRIEIDKKQNRFYARLISPFINQPHKFIASVVIANNIVLVIYGIISSSIIEPFLTHSLQNKFLIFLIITTISTIVILIFGEFLPKSLFMIKPNLMLYLFIIPFIIIYYLISPLLFIFNTISKFTLQLLNKNQPLYKPIFFSKNDLFHFVQNSIENANEQTEVENEIKLIHNALIFDQVKIKECMIPRTEVAAIEITATIQQAKEKFIETGYSKLLVYKQNIDNIIGYIHIADLFSNPTAINDIIRDIIIVPETLTAKKLLGEFIQNKKSIALVVDEFGGTSGIVTIEDILEEIFGEINDEHDTDEYIEKKLSDNDYMFSGRLEIDAINNKYALNIPKSDEYETLAGFILYHHNSIPKTNEIIQIPPFKIKIIKSTNKKIEIVQLTIENQ